MMASSLFAGSRKYGSRHLALLNEAFAEREHMGTVPGGTHHIGFAFSEAGFLPLKPSHL